MCPLLWYVCLVYFTRWISVTFKKIVIFSPQTCFIWACFLNIIIFVYKEQTTNAHMLAVIFKNGLIHVCKIAQGARAHTPTEVERASKIDKKSFTILLLGVYFYIGYWNFVRNFAKFSAPVTFVRRSVLCNSITLKPKICEIYPATTL